MGFEVLRNVFENSDYRNGRSGRNRASCGFVVKADVAADDRDVKSERRITQALNSLDELPHDFRALWIPVVEAVRDPRRARSRAGYVAHRLTDRRDSPVIRVERAGARIRIDLQRKSAMRSFDPQNCRIAAGTHHRVAAHNPIVLPEDPSPRAHVRTRE